MHGLVDVVADSYLQFGKIEEPEVEVGGGVEIAALAQFDVVHPLVAEYVGVCRNRRLI